jgi:small subunit ribosomal protein S16
LDVGDRHAPPPFGGNCWPLGLAFDKSTMVKIRLKRTGAKNSPVYRVVVADGRSPRDGKFIEELGTYWPLRKDELNFSINLDRAKYWLGVGAQPSETVSSMIRKADKVAVVAPAA